jgi:hypothetical protein
MTSEPDIQTVTGARAGVIKLGLDVHASAIVVVRQIDAQVAQPAQRFTPEQEADRKDETVTFAVNKAELADSRTR